ncbi:hypothetical protein P4O66_003240 [Electrophorus voltai]|uniref:Sacsin/Nov domain-containing protein n=1 Tax=Electrophorus voltai TaxID=2609070 RepID=A0AAD8YU31_9TELE|nr:hypothetical protein P4O66_003240 [Electrophorus voltai]
MELRTPGCSPWLLLVTVSHDYLGQRIFLVPWGAAVQDIKQLIYQETNLPVCEQLLLHHGNVELIQNAEDAGATEVKFLYDETEYGVDLLWSHDMAQYQGRPKTRTGIKEQTRGGENKTKGRNQGVQEKRRPGNHDNRDARRVAICDRTPPQCAHQGTQDGTPKQTGPGVGPRAYMGSIPWRGIGVRADLGTGVGW